MDYFTFENTAYGLWVLFLGTGDHFLPVQFHFYVIFIRRVWVLLLRYHGAVVLEEDIF